MRIRGFLNRDGASITATRIDPDDQPVQADRNIIQTLVTSFNSSTRHLTLLGFDVDASGASVQFQDDNDAVLSATQFFGSLTTGKTVVKARGSVSGSSLIANEVELE